MCAAMSDVNVLGVMSLVHEVSYPVLTPSTNCEAQAGEDTQSIYIKPLNNRRVAVHISTADCQHQFQGGHCIRLLTFCVCGWTERNRAIPRCRPFRQAQLCRRGHQQLRPDRGSGVVSRGLNSVTDDHKQDLFMHSIAIRLASILL
jgi:hypothetical protein